MDTRLFDVEAYINELNNELSVSGFVTPEKHQINDRMFEKFKTQCDEGCRSLIELIKEKTLYVSYDEFIGNFINNMQKLIKLYIARSNDEHGPIRVILSRNITNNKLEYWLVLLFISYINIYNRDLTDKDKIKSLIYAISDYDDDDTYFSYNSFISNPCNSLLSSVSQNCSSDFKKQEIFVFLYDLINSNSCIINELDNIYDNIPRNTNDIKFFILCSYFTRDAYNIIKIKNTSHNRSRYDPLNGGGVTKLFICQVRYKRIPIIGDIIKNEEDIEKLEKLGKFYNNTNYFNPSKNLIYFDLKLLDSVSSIPYFYSGLLLNHENYIRITNNKSIQKDAYKSDLLFTPYLNNCAGNIQIKEMNDVNEYNLCPINRYEARI